LFQMASKTGPRAAGTDGTDYLHRQRVAAHYQESATNKFILKFFFGAHVLILAFMFAKVGSEILKKDFQIEIEFFKKLDLPSAYPWEYAYCFSFIAIIVGLMSFSRNKVQLINKCYYLQFLLGILPVMIGMGSQIPEIVEYFRDPEGTNTPTFKGFFPMVFIWYIFFLIALQIHIFTMYFCHQLSAAWTPVKKND
ncbi:hypothetical protein PFISCL1PPCAC_10312, partial [Pristionchus fissidentatus]